VLRSVKELDVVDTMSNGSNRRSFRFGKPSERFRARWQARAGSKAKWVRHRSLTHGAIVTVAILGLTAFAAPTSYLSARVTPGAAGSNIQNLARCVTVGDSARVGCPRAASAQKAAPGIAYEAGKGVGPDRNHTRQLFRASATDISGTIYDDVAATRKGGKGSLVPVDTGLKVGSLREAGKRLKESRLLLNTPRQARLASP
jgi:hypothetical protein